MKIKQLLYKLKIILGQKLPFVFVYNGEFITILLLFSLGVVVKHTSIPFICPFLEHAFSWLFLRPDESTIQFEFLSILYDLSLAYIMSFIVYVITAYLPKREKEKKAIISISGELAELHRGLDMLLTAVMLENDIEGYSSLEVTPQVLEQIEDYNLCDKKAVHKAYRIIACGSSELHEDAENQTTTAFEDYVEACDLVITKIKQIEKSNLYPYLETGLLEILSNVNNNNLVGGYYYTAKACMRLNQVFHPSNLLVSFADAVKNLWFLHALMRRNHIPCYICRRHRMTEEEITQFLSSIKEFSEAVPDYQEQLATANQVFQDVLDEKAPWDR